MSGKKHGVRKFLLFCTFIEGIGAVAYYYFNKKNSEFDDELEDDDFDDFDDFDDDDAASDRGYVNLNSDSKASEKSESEEFFDDEDDDKKTSDEKKDTASVK